MFFFKDITFGVLYKSIITYTIHQLDSTYRIPLKKMDLKGGVSITFILPLLMLHLSLFWQLSLELVHYQGYMSTLSTIILEGFILKG